MKAVEQHRELVEFCLEGEIPVPGLDVATTLAIIHVESAGDVNANRPGSEFHGLLQMGRAAALDVGMEDLGRETTDSLMGNPTAAIVAFIAYVQRYSDRVDSPDLVAVLWKGGAGTARNVIRNQHSMGLDEAIEHEHDVVPRLSEYVRRFRNVRPLYEGGGSYNA